MITDRIKSLANVNIINCEATSLPEADAVSIAAGPLASEGISAVIRELCGDAAERKK